MGHLLQMCKIGEVEEVRAALVNGDVNEADDYGSSCLMWAVDNQHEEVVTLLLGLASLQINAKRGVQEGESRSEWTALHYACLQGGIGVLKKLLDHPGLDVNSRLVCSTNITLGKFRSFCFRDTDGFRPICIAVQRGHADCVRVLASRPTVDLHGISLEDMAG